MEGCFICAERSRFKKRVVTQILKFNHATMSCKNISQTKKKGSVKVHCLNQSHANHMLITCQLHANCMPIARRLHANCMPIARQLHANYTSIIHVNHMPITCQSHANHMPITLITPTAPWSHRWISFGLWAMS